MEGHVPTDLEFYLGYQVPAEEGEVQRSKPEKERGEEREGGTIRIQEIQSIIADFPSYIKINRVGNYCSKCGMWDFIICAVLQGNAVKSRVRCGEEA